MSTTPPSPSSSRVAPPSMHARIKTTKADWLSALINVGTVLQTAALSTHIPVLPIITSTALLILQCIDVCLPRILLLLNELIPHLSANARTRKTTENLLLPSWMLLPSFKMSSKLLNNEKGQDSGLFALHSTSMCAVVSFIGFTTKLRKLLSTIMFPVAFFLMFSTTFKNIIGCTGRLAYSKQLVFRKRLTTSKNLLITNVQILM